MYSLKMMFQYKVLKFLPIKSIATIYIRKSENSLLLDFIFIQHKFIYTTHEVHPKYWTD